MDARTQKQQHACTHNRAAPRNLGRAAARRAVWINCSDRFAHPYTRAAADAWIDTCISSDAPGAPHSQLAIEVAGAAAGGIGVFHRGDVQRHTKELGYWLGERHWGCGVGGGAVGAFLDYLWGAFPDMVGGPLGPLAGRVQLTE